jgi:hypothetical protein
MKDEDKGYVIVLAILLGWYAFTALMLWIGLPK